MCRVASTTPAQRKSSKPTEPPTTFSLRVGDLPYSCIFANKPFDIPIFLVDGFEKLHSTQQAFDVHVHAEYEDQTSPSPVPANLIDVGRESVTIKNGAGVIQCTFKDVSMNHDGNRIIFHISPAGNHPDIKGTCTRPMLAIRHQLVIEEENSAPYMFYKDSGGKDKTMGLKIKLADGFGRRVTKRKVPLRVTLMYRNGQQVPNQTVMTISRESRLMIDDKTEGILKFRINEVSTRHQGNLFQVQISPDTSRNQTTADISSVVSVPIEVRSKKNPPRSCKQNQNDNPNSANKRMRTSETDVSVAAAAGSLFGLARSTEMVYPYPIKGEFGGNAPSGTTTNETSYASSVASERGDSPVIEAYADPVSIGNAVDNLVLWSTNVMRSVDHIQWKQVGYMSHEDGTVDYSRPMHNMQNPNAILHEVAMQFSQVVKSSLMYLTTVADSQGPEDADGKTETVPLAGCDTTASRKRSISSITSITDPSDSHDAPPPMVKENSFGRGLHSLDVPRLSREHSLQGFPLMVPSTDSLGMGLNTPTLSVLKGLDSMDEGDYDVHFILAKSLKSSHGDHGVPAFDADKEFIGVYREGQEAEKVTQAIFTPLSHLASSIPKSDTQRLSSVLNKAIAANDPAVHSLQVWNNNLDTMIEDALIYNMLNLNTEITIGSS